jgi:hypothetical protein
LEPIGPSPAAEVGAEVLADVAARAAVRQLEPEAQAARDDDDLLRLGLDHAELGDEAMAAGLRHEQHLAVGVVEAAASHRPVGRVQVARRRRAARWGRRCRPSSPGLRRNRLAHAGIGSGFQRSWLGGATFGPEVAVMRPLSMRWNGVCIAERADAVEPRAAVSRRAVR